jgi:spermidine synthase
LIKRTYRILNEFRLECIAFVVGLIVLTFELTAARIVAPYLGSTIYTWTSIIGVILAALAVGYSAGGILADKRKEKSDIIVLLVVAAIVIIFINITKEQILRFVSDLPLPLQISSLSASVILFALPTIFLGAVMPYLVKLNINELATSGRKVAHIEAASTLGSLVGTFLTGYILFGFIGTQNLLTMCALVLLLSSFIIYTKKFLWQRIVVIALTIGLSFLSPSPSMVGFIKEIDTAYSRVIVRDIDIRGNDVRVLQTDSIGLQSGIKIKNSDELAFEYTKALANAVAIKPHAKNHLIIGGGAYTLPEYLATTYPESRIDTVEIDGGLASISRSYFDFDQPKNLNIIQADGRQFLNSTDKSYDIIVLDAFNSIVPPFQLLTRQAVQKTKQSLAVNGIVTANIISAIDGSKSQLLKAVNSTYKKEFSFVGLYQVSTKSPRDLQQNLLLIASNDKQIKHKIKKLSDSSLQFSELYKARIDNISDTKILTDDYAPIERYSL